MLRDVIRAGWRDHATAPLDVAARPAAPVHLVKSTDDALLAEWSARELRKVTG